MFCMCLWILIVDPNPWFSKGSSLCIWFPRWPTFKIVWFLQYLVILQAVFPTKDFKIICWRIFGMFLWILIVDPKWWFCKDYNLGIAFPRWPTFKMVWFLQYLVFSRAVFSTKYFKIICWIIFRMIFWISIVDLNRLFCKGYSLCIRFPRWPTFKMVWFLQYLEFLRVVFSRKDFKIIC